MQFTDWLLVKVALLLIGLNKIFWTKYGFNHPLVTESPLGAQRKDPSIPAHAWSKLVLVTVHPFTVQKLLWAWWRVGGGGGGGGVQYF